MNYKKIKELTLQINQLQKELEKQKQLAIKKCKNEGVSKLTYNGVTINYYPQSECVKIDTNKLKQDNLYNKYITTYSKNEYIKISIKEVL